MNNKKINPFELLDNKNEKWEKDILYRSIGTYI